jgi:hypothetical protein
MELPRLSESSSARRTGYSVHRSLLGIGPREKACPRGIPARAVPARTTVSRTGFLSQTSAPFRDTLGRPPHMGPRRRTVASPGSSSHEVLRPSSAQTQRVGTLPRFHPERHPPSAFLRPLRVLSSPRPAALFHAADALGVLRSPGHLSPAELLRARHPAIPSRRFSFASRRASNRHPLGIRPDSRRDPQSSANFGHSAPRQRTDERPSRR